MVHEQGLKCYVVFVETGFKPDNFIIIQHSETNSGVPRNNQLIFKVTLSSTCYVLTLIFIIFFIEGVLS
jgi:hypothetical protein